MTNSLPRLIEPNGRISSFPIERDLKLPNFIRGSYLGCPGHPRVLRFASSL